MRQIANPTRGCGTLKQGGFYASGEGSPNGILRMWTWLLGSMYMGADAKNLMWEIPPRAMQVINLQASLHTLIPCPHFDVEIPENSPAIFLPKIALVDHVGSNHYTPWQFAQEVLVHGPSRRISEQVARQIAGHTPLPIVFTHDWMPLADKGSVAALSIWANDGSAAFWEGKRYEPTWEHEGYGLTIRHEYDGSDHWMIPIMQAIHETAGGKVAPLHKIMEHPLAENVLTSEQPLGVSWVNQVRYVTTGDESQKQLDNLCLSGIEPVRID